MNFSYIKTFKKINFVIIGFKNVNQIKIVSDFKKIRPMSKIEINELQQIVKKSNIENDIDLRFW